ncbi:MAG: hypothetical protein JWO96_185 [Candidatus Saccharibacteria bacterium]|nr:hypothetical protein [Candidatus Saccharibacteria bacterium]
MTNKIISSVILAAAFPIMAITPSNSDSLLFIFISNNKFVATARLALALGMVALSFNLFNFFSTIAKKTFLYSGFGFIIFGLAAGLASSLGSFFYDYLKVLDVMTILEAGIILCSTALLVKAPKAKTRRSASKKQAKPRVALRQA